MGCSLELQPHIINIAKVIQQDCDDLCNIAKQSLAFFREFVILK